jgi:hypothetical protein
MPALVREYVPAPDYCISALLLLLDKRKGELPARPGRQTPDANRRRPHVTKDLP